MEYLSETETPPTVYFAHKIITETDIIEYGAIRVEDGIIASVGPKSGIRKQGDRMVNLGNMTLFPGLVNLHTTFEEASLRGQFSQCSRSPLLYRKEVQKLLTELRVKSDSTLERSAGLTIREALSNGITTHVTTNNYLSGEFLESQPANLISLLNSSNIDGSTQFSFARKIAAKIESMPTSMGFTAPFLYTHDPRYLKEAQRILVKNRYHFQMILSECNDELAAFLEHRGELYEDFIAENPWPFELELNSPARTAIINSLIPRHSTIVHPHYCGTDELIGFQSLSATAAIAPRYTQFFDLRPFPVASAINNRLNIAVCTGSPGLCHNMNLLDELYEIRAAHPSISARSLLNMVTQNPAKALRLENEIGSLQPGKRAHIVGVRSNSLSKTPIEDLIQGEISVEFVIIDGEELIIP